MHFVKFISISIIVFALAGCVSDSYDVNENMNGDGITGKWHDNAGIISDFNEGKFETYTPDTNEKLSEGSYKLDETDSSLVSIELKSLVKGTISQVKCNINETKNKLYCLVQTPEDSLNEPKSFQLFRVN